MNSPCPPHRASQVAFPIHLFHTLLSYHFLFGRTQSLHHSLYFYSPLLMRTNYHHGKPLWSCRLFTIEQVVAAYDRHWHGDEAPRTRTTSKQLRRQLGYHPSLTIHRIYFYNTEGHPSAFQPAFSTSIRNATLLPVVSSWWRATSFPFVRAIGQCMRPCA